MSGENLTPITRKEMFLAKAAGMDVETPEPITREEIFLSKIKGGNGGSGGTGGGASIDVTAKVGQTIVVKEVDANGKPTAWESAEYQPRTHWEETTTIKGDTLTWDGNTDGLTNVSADGATMYCISDATPTMDDFANGFTVIKTTGEIIELTSSVVADYDGMLMCDYFYIIPTDNYVLGGEIVFEKAGFYVSPDATIPFSSFTIPNYGKFVSEQTTVKPMDEKYMPILTSPCGKKFKLSVSDSGAVTATEV